MRRLAYAVAALTGAAALSIALLAPYLYPEYEFRTYGKDPPILPQPSVVVAGRWFDDYFVIEDIDSQTYAIGEPRYYQGNYSYLLVGERRAVLFDAGSGTREITKVVRSLTSLPVTVIPSHLHFDHVGGLGKFERTALPDFAALRSRAGSGLLTLNRYEFLGFMQDLPAPKIRVDEWWAPESVVDLGGRRLRVLSTPGHTATSISLHDESRHQIFVGDFLYPAQLYAFLPGASRSAYLATTRSLLARLDPPTRIYAAHMAGPPASVRAPVLGIADLRALEHTLTGIRAGSESPSSTGEFPAVFGYPRLFPVRGAISFATGYPWNNR